MINIEQSVKKHTQSKDIKWKLDGSSVPEMKTVVNQKEFLF
jgi:hypothetical protein